MGMIFTPDAKELVLDQSAYTSPDRTLVAVAITPATPTAATVRVIARVHDDTGGFSQIESSVVDVNQVIRQTTMGS